MKPKDRILELLKEKPMLIRELQKELQLPTEGIFINAMSFLEKYKLVETMASTKHELTAKITPLGLQLLNLPDLPEDELASDQLEVLERHWGDEVDEQIKGAVEEGEFSEATINTIKAREGKRQKEIAGAAK